MGCYDCDFLRNVVLFQKEKVALSSQMQETLNSL